MTVPHSEALEAGVHADAYIWCPWCCASSPARARGTWEDSNPLLSHLDDYKSELREQLPLIAGSAAAGVVFVVSLVAISIVCSR